MPWPILIGPLPKTITFSFVAERGLVLALVGRIQVGYGVGEFARAGVYPLIDGVDAVFLAQPVYFLEGCFPALGDIFVGETPPFCLFENLDIVFVLFDYLLVLDYLGYLVQEEPVYLGDVVKVVDGYFPP